MVFLALHWVRCLLVLHCVVNPVLDFDFDVFTAPKPCWRRRLYPEDVPFYAFVWLGLCPLLG